MIEVVVSLATAALVAPLMESWARLLHGRIWHGVLYPVHRSHHRARSGRFEANDILSMTHAPLAAALVVIGATMHGLAGAVLRGAGIGMTLFGIAYVVVHDGLVHGRLPVGRLARIRRLRRIVAAHRVHHRTGGPPFGLFRGPAELVRAGRHERAPEARRAAQRTLANGPSAPRTSR